MAIRVKNGELVVLADTNEQELILESLDALKEIPTIFIEVIVSTGGIRFSSGEAVDIVKHRAWPVGGKFPISAHNRLLPLRVKGSEISNSFVPTW